MTQREIEDLIQANYCAHRPTANGISFWVVQMFDNYENEINALRESLARANKLIKSQANRKQMNCCNCPNCRTDNCPAGMELSEAKEKIRQLKSALRKAGGYFDSDNKDWYIRALYDAESKP